LHLQFVDLALGGTVEGRWDSRLGVRGRHRLELFGCLGVIGNHLGGKGLLLGVSAFLAELGGRYLRHVAHRGCLHKIGGGLMPSVEFTPVFSPTDCAKAEAEIRSAAAVIVSAVLFMSRVLAFVRSAQIRSRGCHNPTRPGQMGSEAEKGSFPG
jgi:hypothetical protein